VNCPKCGLEMMDVRASKSSPKAPDFTCTDPNCVNEKGYRTGAWLPKPKPAPQQAAQAVRGPKWTWVQLSTFYGRSLALAAKHIPEIAQRHKIPFTTADILSGAATIFIAATRDGVKELEAPAPPAPAPQPLTERPHALAKGDADDDGLPW